MNYRELREKKKKYFCSNLIYKCTYFIHKVIIIYITPVVSILKTPIIS